MARVFPRYKGLVESGALKETVLYNVMVAIPPHDYPGRSNKVKSIKFPEDKLRKKFYDSQVGKGTEATPLYESSARSICDEFVKVQKEMMSKKMSEAEAFAEAETIINQRMKNTSPVSKAGKNSQKVIHDLLQSIKDAQANKMLGGAKARPHSVFIKR